MARRMSLRPGAESGSVMSALNRSALYDPSMKTPGGRARTSGIPVNAQTPSSTIFVKSQETDAVVLAASTCCITGGEPNSW